MSAERLDEWFKDIPDQTQVPPEQQLTKDDVLSFLPADIDKETQDILFQALGIDQPAAKPVQGTGDFYEKNFGVPAGSDTGLEISLAEVGSSLDNARERVKNLQKELRLDDRWYWIDDEVRDITDTFSLAELGNALEEARQMRDDGFALAPEDCAYLAACRYFDKSIDDRRLRNIKKRWDKQRVDMEIAQKADSVLKNAGNAIADLFTYICADLPHKGINKVYSAYKNWRQRRAERKAEVQQPEQTVFPQPEQPEPAVHPAQEPAKPAWYSRAGGALKRAGAAAFRYVNKKADEGTAYAGNRIGYKMAAAWHSPRTRTFLKYALPAALLAGVGVMGYTRYRELKSRAPKPVAVNLDEKLMQVRYNDKLWEIPEHAVRQVEKYIVQSCNKGRSYRHIEQCLKDASAVDGTADNRIYTPGLKKLK